MTAIGMNLSSNVYWSTEYPFLDRFKSSGGWVAVGTDYKVMPGGVPLDANGYPAGMPANALSIYTMVNVDPVTAGTSDLYVLTYSGTATFSLSGTTIVSSQPGRIVFRYDGTDAATQLAVTSIDPQHPVNGIHVVRQDQEALYATGELFNPAFVAKASEWNTLRYKDWINTDNSTLTSWSQRTTVNSASWASNDHVAGVPIEVMVKLANETHTHMWIDIPAQADDDYVRQTLGYVRDHLDAGLKVNVEYSNEVWNWGYAQATYAMTMGDKLWGTDANHDGRIDPKDPAEHVSDGWMQYYGYRSAQVASIAKSVFGDAAGDRLVDVLATQTGFTGLEQSILKGVAQANLGPASALFGSYAVTTYFGGALEGATAADQAKVLAWARGGSAGLDAAFHELEFGGGGFSGGQSLADLVPIFAYQAKVAAANGLALVAYEGGVSLTATAYDPAVRAEIVAFFDRLDADPRMGALYTKMTADFAAAGGTELTAFQDAGHSSVYGTFAVLDTIYDNGSPRYDALLAAAKDTVGASAVTALAAYTLDANAAALTYSGTGAFTGTGNQFDNVITGGPGGNVLRGLAGNDTLIGGAGADLLDGGMGFDRMVGGGGNDIYMVDSRGDVVVEEAGGGIDEVRTTLASYTLGDNLENLTFNGTDAFAGTGNALNNVITGATAKANMLYGLAGNDVLVGGTANDVLDGGVGADQMSGGAGDDLYFVDNAGDVVVEQAGEGIDEVRTTLGSYTLGANVERLIFTGNAAYAGRGNALDNVLTANDAGGSLYGMAGNDVLQGGAGNDLLDGGAGADRMSGGAGNDVYIVDDIHDVVTEAAGGGIDEIRTALAGFALPANVERLIFTGTGPFGGGGNDGDNVIDAHLSSAAQISGGGGNDTLTTGAGNDTLDGGSGVDTMTGGAGDDTYYVDNTADVIVELARGGNDRVLASASYTLGDNVESLQLIGSGAINGTGNALANVIYGNDAANILSGMAGDDTLSGGGGDDQLSGGRGNDMLLGGAGNDVLNGDAGDDSLDGGAGNDTLRGGDGRDWTAGGAGADRFVFKTGDFATAPAGGGPVSKWADVIADFSHREGDRIDLAQLDAINATAANDPFRFIGAKAFTGHAGELRAESTGGGYDVMGDQNGDGIADFHLFVVSATPLVAADFYL